MGLMEQIGREIDAEFRRTMFKVLTPLDKQRCRTLLAAAGCFPPKPVCVICGASDVMCEHVFDRRNTNGT